MNDTNFGIDLSKYLDTYSNRLDTYRKLSVEEMNEIVAEKIPLDDRLKSVYLPIFTMDCACYLAEDLLKMLGSLRLDSTKKLSRHMKTLIDGYRKDNWKAMTTTLYKDLAAFTEEFYTSITTNMTIYWIQYQQELLRRNIEVGGDVQKTVSIAYVVRELVQFVINMDREFSKRISETLGKTIRYTTEDNHYCLDMIKAINNLFVILKVPKDMRTDQTDTAFRIIKNRINSIKI